MQLNEDMLVQLRAAQEEAARLKKELEVLQEQRVRGAAAPHTPSSGRRSSRCIAAAALCVADIGHAICATITSPPGPCWQQGRGGRQAKAHRQHR